VEALVTVSLLPVRELITVHRVDTIRLAGGETLFLVKGYVFAHPTEQRSMRTPDGWKATACKSAIGNPPLWLTWKANPFHKLSFLEHDLVTVEL
jgi:hypothetical protein